MELNSLRKCVGSTFHSIRSVIADNEEMRALIGAVALVAIIVISTLYSMSGNRKSSQLGIFVKVLGKTSELYEQERNIALDQRNQKLKEIMSEIRALINGMEKNAFLLDDSRREFFPKLGYDFEKFTINDQDLVRLMTIARLSKAHPFNISCLIQEISDPQLQKRVKEAYIYPLLEVGDSVPRDPKEHEIVESLSV